jgi:hypothetical protein
VLRRSEKRKTKLTNDRELEGSVQFCTEALLYTLQYCPVLQCSTVMYCAQQYSPETKFKPNHQHRFSPSSFTIFYAYFTGTSDYYGTVLYYTSQIVFLYGVLECMYVTVHRHEICVPQESPGKQLSIGNHCPRLISFG